MNTTIVIRSTERRHAARGGYAFAGCASLQAALHPMHQRRMHTAASSCLARVAPSS